MAAGAAMGTAAGPIGGAIGAAVGAIAGGLAGKGVAEQVNPTEEDAYWRDRYSNEPYYEGTYSYDDYRGAYRTGYEGYSRLGTSGKRYEDIEPELRRDYERNYGTSRLGWDKARTAARAAWQRLEHRGTSTTGHAHSGTHTADLNLERYVGYSVVDRNGNDIGTLECLWADHTGEPAFVGVRTGWFLGKTHVVPAESVEVSDRGQRLRLPYSIDKVKEAPSFDADAEMSDTEEQEVYRYYGLTSRLGRTTGAASSSGAMGTTGLAGTGTGTTAATARAMTDQPRPTGRTEEEATLRLAEEQLRVGKREVEAGGVRLRKVVRTETVNQPVELRREEIVIERVPADQARGGARGASFEEQEVYIPLRREEAVVEKETRLREEVRARKESQTDTQNVSGQVRKEDVEVERTGEARDEGTTRTPRSRKP